MPVNHSNENLFAPGAVLLLIFSKKMAFTQDYHQVLNGLTAEGKKPLSSGINIETGEHVFQLHFSKGTDMNERALIGETYGYFFKGESRFGFSLLRICQIGKR